MSGNGFGHIFRFTTFGESHGEAIGCVVEGVPSNIDLSPDDIQVYLDRRRPGQSEQTSARQEKDRVEILSGVFEGKTTGTPIGLLIRNADHRSKDYDGIKDKFRPAHADVTYSLKYGNRDYRGGGRASARETALRVAAGAIARKILTRFIKTPFKITAGLVQMGGIKTNGWDDEAIGRNPFFCPDAAAVPAFEKLLEQTRKNGSSIGGKVEIRAEGFPLGLGEPVYDKLDADLAKALMSINAVKGVEIGAGFDVVAMTGEENADEMRYENDRLVFLSNNAGGILGGLSTSQPIIARIALKPTPSVLSSLSTVTVFRENAEVETKGRHDPCVAIRAVPVAEAMTAVTLADHLLRLRAFYD